MTGEVTGGVYLSRDLFEGIALLIVRSKSRVSLETQGRVVVQLQRQSAGRVSSG